MPRQSTCPCPQPWLGTTCAGKKRRAKSKRIRYPKGFDPEHPERTPPPDPERWLPKHERSTYRARKKDRGRVARGPQVNAGPRAPCSGYPIQTIRWCPLRPLTFTH